MYYWYILPYNIGVANGGHSQSTEVAMSTKFLQQVQSIMQDYAQKSQTICDPTLSDTSCDIWISEIERLVVTRLPQITETGWADDYMLVCYHYPHIDGPPTVVPVSHEPKCLALQLASDVGEEAILEGVRHLMDTPRTVEVA